MGEFLIHELGSGKENYDENIEEMMDENLLMEEIREKREATKYDESEIGDDGSSNEFSGEEENGSEDAIDYLDVVRLLCDVDPTTLTLTNVTRQFSGRYSCALVQDKRITSPSRALEVSVECKFRKKSIEHRTKKHRLSMLRRWK